MCKISTRVQLTLALISIAVVLIFFITVIADLGGDNDVAKAFDPSPAGGFSGILFGVLYGVLIFVGFETAANLAEETAEPKRAIPRAVLGAVAIVSIFYLIAAYVEVAGFGFDLSVITSPEVAGAPLFALGAPPGPAGVGVLAEDPAAWSCSSTCWRSTSARPSPRPAACSRWLAIGGCRARSPRCRSATGRRWPRSCC